MFFRLILSFIAMTSHTQPKYIRHIDWDDTITSIINKTKHCRHTHTLENCPNWLKWTQSGVIMKPDNSRWHPKWEYKDKLLWAPVESGNCIIFLLSLFVVCRREQYILFYLLEPNAEWMCANVSPAICNSDRDRERDQRHQLPRRLPRKRTLQTHIIWWPPTFSTTENNITIHNTVGWPLDGRHTHTYIHYRRDFIGYEAGVRLSDDMRNIMIDRYERCAVNNTCESKWLSLKWPDSAES